MKKMPKHKTYISFVVVGRNDNYGGDFLHRINVFAKVLLTLCEKYELNSELVIVEWNPLSDTPGLKDAISWPDIQRRCCQIRVIEVPHKLHRKLPNSKRTPLFEYIGKNVGVRRARGEYILATNPDLLYSEKLIDFLGSGKLSPKCFYRIARHDVKSPVSLDIPVEKQLDYCKNNVIKVHTYFGSFNNRFNSIRFKGFARHLRQRFWFFPFAPPYTNASGDFFLMHRKHWHSLRGYPELKGWHQIDGLVVYMALFSEVKQIILRTPLRVYHQDHGRLESDKPRSPEVESAYDQMLKEHRPLILNDNEWGLGKEDLSEFHIPGDSVVEE